MNNVTSQATQQKIAIIGSGPSGFYAAEALLKSRPGVKITMLERLPVPYGLVRSGVAPDHPKLKQAIDVYARIAESTDFSFLGNVTVGRDISIQELRTTHDAIVIACGAESDRKLDIEGEELPGSHTATEFVGWYNGHPNYRNRQFNLGHDTAVIIGQGNVAADVARILAKTADELRHTDIAEHALEALSRSKIRHIHVIGRRGPVQAKFTSKELKEFGELQDCNAIVDPSELELNPASQVELDDKSSAGTRKVYELFSGFTQAPADPGKNRKVYFTFLKSPVTLSGTGRVEKITLELNRLSGEPFRQSATGTGNHVDLDTGIVFRSIGYRGIPLPGLPFDDRRGIIPNDIGRVIDGGHIVPGIYVAGWIKRGPTGIIGTNRADSVATVQSLLEDLGNTGTDLIKSGAEGARSILQQRGIRYVSFSDWKKIDQSEIERGQSRQKPREKYTYLEEMFRVLD